MKTSPLQQVKGNFGDKAKLISAVQALATDALWLDRVNKDKGLAKISNSKLIRLHAALSRPVEHAALLVPEPVAEQLLQRPGQIAEPGHRLDDAVLPERRRQE